MKSLHLSLPPLVFYEILLRSNPKPSLKWIQQFNFRLGKFESGPNGIQKEIVSLSEKEILRFEPFYPPQDSIYSNLRAFLNGPPTDVAIEEAKRVKKEHRKFISETLTSVAKTKRTLLDLKAQNKLPNKFKLKCFEEILSNPDFAGRPDSFLGDFVFGVCLDKDIKGFNREKIFETVMKNQYLGRFCKMYLCYTVSVCRLWENQTYNFDPQENRDDWTDITLALYVADGDTVITNDIKLRNLFSMVNGNIIVKNSL